MNDFDKRLASLKSVLTCEICKKLCKDVTIIEECCHRFCKKCITRRISKEKWNVCPECNMDLGIVPLQKIRFDHQMQGIRDIFSSKRRELIELGLIEKSKKDEPKKLPHEDIDLNYSAKMLIDPLPPPEPVVVATSSRRKEKSISSIVESIGYAVESSKNDGISKKNKSIEPLDGMNDLWEPLNNLVTKGDTLDNSKESVPKFISSTPLINLDNYENEDDNDDEEEDEEYVPSPKVKENKVSKQSVVQAIEAPSSNHHNKIDKGKKGRCGRKKKETNNPPLPLVGGSVVGGGKNINVAQVGVTTETIGGTSSGSTRVVNERVHPIWFTLVACDKQKGPSPLPQISSRYIKIKDVNKSSSYIKKYLAHKLSLQSEDEVEIHMLGMPIQPSLPLKHLAKLWLDVAPNSRKILAKVGASAQEFSQEFFMVLNYSRSHP
ncbi:hypothetical protein H5410_002223 [Solanum commersonii]|uniref:RING-type domain-containing protein n=1 Tax=Solanum commersonii TaxID=4109 RepID=A0A9J6B1Q2_SOLCO|nr:hypothetical protein H5410_002223 [Solanum commersonii]